MSTSTYSAQFMTLADGYAHLLRQRGEAFLVNMANTPSVRLCVLEIYALLKKYGRLTPIEALPADEKAALWAEAKRLRPAGTKDECVQVSKCLHALGCYLNEQNSTTNGL